MWSLGRFAAYVRTGESGCRPVRTVHEKRAKSLYVLGRRRPVRVRIYAAKPAEILYALGDAHVRAEEMLLRSRCLKEELVQDGPSLIRRSAAPPQREADSVLPDTRRAGVSPRRRCITVPPRHGCFPDFGRSKPLPYDIPRHTSLSNNKGLLFHIHAVFRGGGNEGMKE